LGRLEQSRRAGEIERGEGLLTRNNPSCLCPPVPNDIIEPPRETKRLGSGKGARRVNWFRALDRVWTIGFKNEIGLPREIITGLIPVDHETSQDRGRVKCRVMKDKGFAPSRHEVSGSHNEMCVERHSFTFRYNRARVASEPEDRSDHPKTLLVNHDL
jgi:hypothetical protein